MTPTLQSTFRRSSIFILAPANPRTASAIAITEDTHWPLTCPSRRWLFGRWLDILQQTTEVLLQCKLKGYRYSNLSFSVFPWVYGMVSSCPRQVVWPKRKKMLLHSFSLLMDWFFPTHGRVSLGASDGYKVRWGGKRKTPVPEMAIEIPRGGLCFYTLRRDGDIWWL